MMSYYNISQGIVLASAMAFITPSAHADILEKIDVSATLETKTGISVNRSEFQKNEVLFTPEATIELGASTSLSVVGRVRFDANNKIDHGNHSQFSLREAYIDHNVNTAYFRIGKQQIVWGQADGLKVLDVLNPQSFREFILPDFEESRIGLWSLNIEVPISQITAQFIWIPDTRYNKVPGSNDLYAFTSPRLSPDVPSGIEVERRPVREPSHLISDSDVGLKLAAFWGGWDLTLNYAYHYADTPVIRVLSAQGASFVDGRYERSHLFGGTFSNVFGDFTLRGELGLSTNRYFQNGAVLITNGVSSANDFSSVIGLDYAGVEDWFLSAQLFQSRLSALSGGTVRAKTETSFTILARRDFLNETLQAEGLLVHNFNDDDGVFQFDLIYDWSTNLRFKIGADFFYGNENGLYGQFDNNDRLTVGLELSF